LPWARGAYEAPRKGTLRMKIAVAICIGVLAAGAAYADRVVIGYRTYMATFPFNGC
jgi:hypothetical protein